MDFRFTDEQQELIKAAKSFFEGEHTPERMRAQLNAKDVEPLMPQCAALGLIGIIAAPDHGGLGQDFTVMAAIAEAAGYVGFVESYVETAGIVVPLLQLMGETEKLEQVIAGTLHIAPLSPRLFATHAADKCDYFIETHPKGHKLIGKDELTLTLLQSIDPLRKIFKVNHSAQGCDLSNWYGGVLSAAQICGLARRIIDISVDYAKERQQFGQAIGAFQAIKHHLANVHIQIEFTRPTVFLAALQGGRAVHQAKIAAIDTGILAAETGIQVHGGMGYTYEVSLHLFMKRIWALMGEWGDRSEHLNSLTPQIMGNRARIGPGTSFESVLNLRRKK